jgi:hypothetical protein
MNPEERRKDGRYLAENVLQEIALTGGQEEERLWTAEELQLAKPGCFPTL